MHFNDKRLSREYETIARMAEIYCAAHHQRSNDHLCDSCQEFLDYAGVRLEKCPYGEDKPTCANCPIHCYKPARKEQVREIMRYAGPRMLWRHPLLTIPHLLDGFRKVTHPRTLTREERLQNKHK